MESAHVSSKRMRMSPRVFMCMSEALAAERFLRALYRIAFEGQDFPSSASALVPSPAANSLSIRIARRQPQPGYLSLASPAANSLSIRIGRRQPQPGYLSLGT